MPDNTSMLTGGPARIDLKTYTAELPLGTLVVGVDNIHHDVFLSPQFIESTGDYLLEFIRQEAKLSFLVKSERDREWGHNKPLAPNGKPLPANAKRRSGRAPEASNWKRSLSELLHGGLQQAKYQQNIEIDLLLRVALLKFLIQEIGTQFANLLLEGKERIRSRGGRFEQSEQAHVMKARLAELQADRRRIFRLAGQHLFQVLQEIEDNGLARSRRALFGDEVTNAYDLLANRLAFVENGKDDVLFLEQYVLLGNYAQDEDRFEAIDALMLEFLRESLMAGGQDHAYRAAQQEHKRLANVALAARAEIARLEEQVSSLTKRLERATGLIGRVGFGGDPDHLRNALANHEKQLRHSRAALEKLGAQVEATRSKEEYLAGQYRSQLGDYLNRPENARRLFDASAPEVHGDAAAARAQLLEDWLNQLEQRALIPHILASYHLRNICHDYCPPLHLQQLKKALVVREEYIRVEAVLKQFSSRPLSMQRIDELAKQIRRTPREEMRAVALRFSEDFMRLRRDRRNYDRLTAAMERVNLVRNERTREVSSLNNSVYEFLLPTETKPVEDRVLSHTVIKADVRGSTKITQDLLARGLNPASLFSLNFYEPVKRILERYGAAKVFIEGDALVLAIFETESNRAQQRPISKACALARQILAISLAYNERAGSSDLPRLELGVGIAYQGSAPTYWIDSDSRIMISRALNLSDRLSSCSKAAKRLLAENTSPFQLFLFQTMMEGAEEEESQEFLIRFNLNGVELNGEGFQKLQEEIATTSVEADCWMPWGRERVTFFIGETPVGEGVEPVLIRRGFVRHLLPDGKIGAATNRAYYEVCTRPKVFEMVECLVPAAETQRV